MGKVAILVLIVAYASATLMVVNGNCVDRKATNSTSESAMDKVSNFFEEMGCTIKDGAGRVKEHIESGYNYLKEKMTIDNKNQTTTEAPSSSGNQVAPEMGEKQAIEGIDPNENEELPASFMRSALVAPIMCPNGQVQVNGKCRQDI